jgi:hypothetical protein
MHMPDYTVKLSQKSWEAFESDATLARAVVFSDKSEPTAMIKVCVLLSRCRSQALKNGCVAGLVGKVPKSPQISRGW